MGKNKRLNNKGFTLIELIVAMGIMSMVILVGYRVINATTDASKKQQDISNAQLSANLVNKYLTKDLERSKTFNDSQENIYSIEDVKGNTITYEVVKDTDKGTYDLIRKENDQSIKIVSNQLDGSEYIDPLYIEKKDDGLYFIELFIKDNIYEFEVSSRLENNKEKPNDNELKEYNGMGFKVVYENKKGFIYLINKDEHGNENEQKNPILETTNRQPNLDIIFNGSYAIVSMNGIQKFKINKINKPSIINVNVSHKNLYEKINVYSNGYKEIDTIRKGEKTNIEIRKSIDEIKILSRKMNSGSKDELKITWD